MSKNTTIASIGMALLDLCAELGLDAPVVDETTESGLPENSDWIFLGWGARETGAAQLIFSKNGRHVHSHLDLSAYAGHIALPRKNGKVICHFTPSLDLLAPVLHLFVGASKRATIVASKRDSQTASTAAGKPVVVPILVRKAQATLERIAEILPAALEPAPAYEVPEDMELDSATAS